MYLTNPSVVWYIFLRGNDHTWVGVKDEGNDNWGKKGQHVLNPVLLWVFDFNMCTQND